jgi:predicted outer membrane repeat protein
VSGTWRAAGSPYLIEGEITIPADSTLIIEPGVEVIFQGYYKLVVNGFLDAVGTETDSILFTAADTSEGWHSIRFIEAPDSSRLFYGVVQYGRATGSEMDLNGGGIYSYFSNPSINHCTISQNSAENMGGGIYCWASNATIDHCIVSGNRTNNWSGRGGGVCGSCSDFYINNCTVIGNSAGGSLEFGGGIYCGDSSPTILNTIVEGNSGDGGIYLDGCCTNFLIAYNDLFNNESGNFSGFPFQGLGEIVTVNLNGDSCDVFFNIFADPLFIDPGVGNLHLRPDSPCIDAGDPASPPDPDSTITDIGAFYYDQLVGTQNPNKAKISREYRLLPAYPNPFNPSTVIRYQLSVVSFVNLVVYDVGGRKVADLVDGWRAAGEHEVTFNASGLAAGIYFCRIEAGDFSAVRKMVLIK